MSTQPIHIRLTFLLVAVISTTQASRAHHTRNLLTINTMKKTSFLLFTAIVVAACGVHKHQFTNTSYAEIRTRSNDSTTVRYNVPSVIPTGKTIQTQTKGGVIVSVEVEPFTVSNNGKQIRTIAQADPTKPGFDRYEVTNSPDYVVTPDRVKFKIRIRNNEQVPLVLERIGFILTIDGVQYSFPKEQIEEWNKGIVVTGFEKTFEIPGPQAKELHDGQTVFLFLNGVPTSYNVAGDITRKSNFEWYFSCKNEQKSAMEEISYRYEFVPVHKEQCTSCAGRSYTSSFTTCGYCSGTGRIRNNTGTYQCTSCAGSGRREIKTKCGNCGATGSISYPKSPMPKVIGSETWTGWEVKITTVPAGIPVRIMGVKSNQYENAGTSNCTVHWYNSNRKNCPIILDYQDKEIKLMPLTASGKESKSITVDFSMGEPIIKGGTRVQ